jgi:hypothetical protein
MAESRFNATSDNTAGQNARRLIKRKVQQFRFRTDTLSLLSGILVVSPAESHRTPFRATTAIHRNRCAR